MITTLNEWRKYLNENKHQGKEFIYDDTTILYHSSNPGFRDLIEKEGLKPMKGDSYSTYSPEESAKPAIFMYTGKIGSYDSTYDDDIWKISCKNLTNKIYTDNEVTDGLLTYDSIPRSNIELAYKGTGEPMDDEMQYIQRDKLLAAVI